MAIALTVIVGLFIIAVRSDALNIENLPIICDVVDAVEAKIVPALHITTNEVVNIILSLLGVFLITWLWWPILIIAALVVTIIDK